MGDGLARSEAVFIYLFIYFDIQRHPHWYNSGYYVEVKNDSEKKTTIVRRRMRIRLVEMDRLVQDCIVLLLRETVA